MTSNTLSIGQQLKREGQQTALINAGASWVESMLKHLHAFVIERREQGVPDFRFEEFRALAIDSGWPLPCSHKAWGALPRVAQRRGIIKYTGRREVATSAKTHGCEVRVWRAA